jgi:hypothetical protein
MVHSKAMGIGAMFVLLVVAIVILPMIVRYIDTNEVHFVMSGFMDVPSTASMSSSSYTPDSNTKYLCRSPNDSGEPCEEGTFCDGTNNRCVKIFPKSNINLEHGYYS